MEARVTSELVPADLIGEPEPHRIPDELRIETKQCQHLKNTI